MAKGPLLVNLFCEDTGHEQAARAIVSRVASEEQIHVRFRSESARGGHGAAVSSFCAYQVLAREGLAGSVGDLVVILIDGNAAGWHAMRKEIEGQIDPAVFPRWVVGCPDPHVEAWCLSDARAVQKVTGSPPPGVPARGGRGAYKKALVEALRAGKLPILGDPMDYAPKFVQALDWYRAGKASPSLKDFVAKLRSSLVAAAKEK